MQTHAWSGLRTLLRPTRNHFRLLMVILVAAGCLTVYLKYFTPEKRAVRLRLSEADEKSKAAIDERLKPLRQLFAKARKGAKPFAEQALSLGGKWALVKGFFVDDSHREYLSEAFAEHVFSPKELRDAIEAACLSYTDDLDGVENEMLVLLRADIADPERPAALLPSHLQSDEAFKQEYRKLAIRVAGESRTDLAVAAGREVLVFVGTEVATRAAMQAAKAAAAQLGIQGGVLGAGASSTVATLGVGLVVAIIIDYVIDAVFKMVGYDPQAKIEATVIGSINRLEEALTHDPGLGWHLGLDQKGSLRVEMEKLHESRSKLRRIAVELMLNEGDRK